MSTPVPSHDTSARAGRPPQEWCVTPTKFMMNVRKNNDRPRKMRAMNRHNERSFCTIVLGIDIDWRNNHFGPSSIARGLISSLIFQNGRFRPKILYFLFNVIPGLSKFYFNSQSLWFGHTILSVNYQRSFFYGIGGAGAPTGILLKESKKPWVQQIKRQRRGRK